MAYYHCTTIIKFKNFVPPGLDPAGPLFHQQVPALRINPNSADFVDIIHTNGCRIPGVTSLQKYTKYIRMHVDLCIFFNREIYFFILNVVNNGDV